MTIAYYCVNDFSHGTQTASSDVIRLNEEESYMI